MARTYKDMPYEIRRIKKARNRVPADWREKTRWIYAPRRFTYRKTYDGANTDWSLLAESQSYYQQWCNERDELFGAAKKFGYKDWYDGVPAEFRKDLNRAYRAKTKQMIREEKYEVPRPRRNAAWLYW